jgi:hypothetical protein
MSVRPLLALVLGILVAVAVGCGDRSSLLSSADSVGLKDELSAVQTALDDGNCAEASRAAVRFESAARSLPTSVDAQLRARIREGAADLVAQVPTDCRKRTVTTETTTVETTPTTTTTTTPTTTTPTTTVPTIPSTIPTTPTGGTQPGTGGTGDGGTTP